MQYVIKHYFNENKYYTQLTLLRKKNCFYMILKYEVPR